MHKLISLKNLLHSFRNTQTYLIRLLAVVALLLSFSGLAAAQSAGFRIARLGPRVLRTETAGVAVLAAMNALWGDWR